MEFIVFMKAGTCPWICRHCDRNGLPNLQKNSDSLVELQETTTKKFNRLENTTLKEIKESNDRQFTKLDQKITVLEQSIDAKIDSKFEDKKEEIKKSLEKSITHTMSEKITKLIEEQMAAAEIPDLSEIESNVTKKLLGSIDKIIDEKLKEINTPNPDVTEANILKILEQKMEERLETAKNEEMTQEKKGRISSMIESMIEEKMKTMTPVPSSSAAKQVSPRTYMKNTVKNVACELKEKEKRMKNIIVYGIQESAAMDQTQRAKEDKAHLLQMLDDKLGITAIPEDIRDNFRLGKNNPNRDQSKPLPLLVTFNSLSMKEDIFKNLHRLRGDKSLSFSNDLTPFEREEHKQMVDEAKTLTKNDQTGAVYRVRGPPWDRRIVKIVTREEVVQNPPIEVGATQEGTPQ